MLRSGACWPLPRSPAVDARRRECRHRSPARRPASGGPHGPLEQSLSGASATLLYVASRPRPRRVRCLSAISKGSNQRRTRTAMRNWRPLSGSSGVAQLPAGPGLEPDRLDKASVANPFLPLMHGPAAPTALATRPADRWTQPEPLGTTDTSAPPGLERLPGRPGAAAAVAARNPFRKCGPGRTLALRYKPQLLGPGAWPLAFTAAPISGQTFAAVAASRSARGHQPGADLSPRPCCSSASLGAGGHRRAVFTGLGPG